MLKILLSVLLAAGIFTSCTEFVGNLKKPKKKRVVKRWRGSPYVEWKSRKIQNVVILRNLLKQGIFSYEGTFNSKGIFKVEKSILLNYKGKLLWRRALNPHLDDETNTFSSHIVIINNIGQDNKKNGILSWVQGDLFRFQDIITGKDIWNSPNCKFPMKYQKFIAGYCFGQLTLMNPVNGKAIHKINLPVIPANMWRFQHGFIISDKDKGLHYYNVEKSKMLSFPARPAFNKIKVTKKRIYTLYKTNQEYFIEMFNLSRSMEDSLNQKVIRSKWIKRLSVVPPVFWVREHDDAVIIPMGLDCMMSRTMQSGMELWTSCGIYLINPPTYDDFGLYMLSSIKRKKERSIIFIDGDNGLQTPLFKAATEEDSVKAIQASFIAPGKVENGLIYTIRGGTNIEAIRIAPRE